MVREAAEVEAYSEEAEPAPSPGRRPARPAGPTGPNLKRLGATVNLKLRLKAIRLGPRDSESQETRTPGRADRGDRGSAGSVRALALRLWPGPVRGVSIPPSLPGPGAAGQGPARRGRGAESCRRQRPSRL